MHPELITFPLFGGVTIHTYGALVALAFLVGLLWVKREAALHGQDPALALDLVFYIIIAALIASRILGIITDPADRARIAADPISILKIWQGGLVFYGGFIGAILISLWFFRKHKLPALIYFDIFAPGLPLGHAIGRLGCFMAGCCYGKVAHGNPWYAVIFPDISTSSAPGGIPLYPTQLMESSGEFFIFLLLLVVRKYKRFDGQLVATYLILYSILRAIIELFRGDVIRGFVIDPWLSTSQFISIMMFIIGATFYVKYWNKGKMT